MPTPSGLTVPSAIFFWYSRRVRLVNPHLFERTIFCLSRCWWVPASEFVLSTAEGLHSLFDVGLADTDGVENRADLDSGHLTDGLSEGSSHTGLEPIGTGATEHLVNTQTVPGVDSAAHVEVILADGLGEVLVGHDTGSFESLGGDLLAFLRNDVNDEGELVHRGLLSSDVVDADLGVGNTTVVA